MTEAELISEIRRVPGLYLGKESITRLASFLDGFAFAGNTSPGSGGIEGFQQYIQERYQVVSSHRWDEIILFFEGDEVSAFKRFFELLDEFLSGNGNAS